MAVGLLSGVMATFGLVAVLAVSRLVDGLRLNRDFDELAPLAAAVAIALAGAGCVFLARNTVLNRRRSWLEHGLGELVLAHELWLASGQSQQDRTLAAVRMVSRFVAGSAARALCEAPWALAVLGGVWLIDPDLAVIANTVGVVLLMMALSGSRMTRAARAYDVSQAAATTGYDVVSRANIGADASLDLARDVASRWEVTQRACVAATYASAQARARRMVLASFVLAAGTIGMLAVALHSLPRLTATAGHGSADVFAVCVAVLIAHMVLLKWAVDAPEVAAARAAQRQLATLRVARTRNGHIRKPALAAPDLRAPMAAGAFATVVTAVALVGAVVHWHLPLAVLSQGDRGALDAVPQPLRAHLPGAQSLIKSQVRQNREVS